MSPILLLLIGMAVVLGGVLGLRLHAFLALIIGALCIGALTPESAVEDFAIEKFAKERLKQNAKLGREPLEGAADKPLLEQLPPKEQEQVVASAEKFASQNLGARVAAEFGDGCRKVGILIAMAAIIGKCLLDSGAALRIVQTILTLFGAARAQLAFLFSSFLLAIPVFFDTVFYLLIPIGKAMRRKVGKNYLLYILTIVAGGTMAHSLIPPTPGPLIVAAELNVDVGTMMLVGLVVGLFTVSFGYFYAIWANKRWEIPLPDEEEGEEEQSHDQVKMPPAILAFLPVVLPLILIGLGRYSAFLKDSSPGWLKAVAYLGDKNLALTISAAIALLILVMMKRGQRDAIASATTSAISSGAGIIMITAAGAAFGGVLRHTGIAGAIAELGGGQAGVWTLVIAFGVTALVRTAQGSATVAMITAAPIAASFVGAGDLGFHPVYLAIAIGCGSKPIPWMNDSGFWTITRMTGMKESETLRIVTPMMSLMGLVGLIVTVIGALVVPLV